MALVDLSWLTTIPASTTPDHTPGAPEGAEDLRLVTALVTGGGLDYRRTPIGDAVADLLARADAVEARLAALLTPVEGLDLEKVDKRLEGETLDRWDVLQGGRAGEPQVAWAVETPIGTLIGWDRHLTAEEALLLMRRLAAAPALVREVIRARSMATDYQALAAHREGEVDQWRARAANLEQELGRLQSALGGEMKAIP